MTKFKWHSKLLISVIATVAVLFGCRTCLAAAAYQIDCGGTASGSYVADADYSGGTSATVTNAINTSTVINPAPAAVYQSERWGPSTYTFNKLTANATYTVRLHFCEIYFTAAGKRKFNVAINGTQVLTNFDIFSAAGGANIANIQQFSAKASAAGTITLAFTNGTADQAKVSGIEIYAGAAYQINCGPSAVGTWSADTAYVSGGNGTYSVTSAIATTGLVAPAPAGVYQSERFGAMTYTIPGLAPSSPYTVRLHFCEVYYTAPNQRQFNVLINNSTVLSNFDIIAASGAIDVANIQTFNVTSSTTGTVVIQLTVGAYDLPKISGIEIVPGQATTVVSGGSGRAMWVWGAPYSNQSYANSLLTWCSAPDGNSGNTIKSLFVNTPGFTSGAAPDPSVQNFISRCHNQGIKIYCLDGDPNWGPAGGDDSPALSEIDNIVAFNKASSASQRWDGICWDAENNNYTGSNGTAFIKLYSDSRAELTKDAPPSAIKLCGTMQIAAQGSVEQNVLKYADSIAGMAYRNTVNNGGNDITAIGSGFASDAQSAGKPFWIGVETGNLGPTDAFETFDGFSIPQMESVLSSATTYFKGNSTFNGIVIEDYDTYSAMTP